MQLFDTNLMKDGVIIEGLTHELVSLFVLQYFEEKKENSPENKILKQIYAINEQIASTNRNIDYERNEINYQVNYAPIYKEEQKEDATFEDFQTFARKENIYF